MSALTEYNNDVLTLLRSIRKAILFSKEVYFGSALKPSEVLELEAEQFAKEIKHDWNLIVRPQDIRFHITEIAETYRVKVEMAWKPDVHEAVLRGVNAPDDHYFADFIPSEQLNIAILEPQSFMLREEPVAVVKRIVTVCAGWDYAENCWVYRPKE